jgi:8-oxo-dGTP pyrophosphatase MutT (NUDIX family)
MARYIYSKDDSYALINDNPKFSSYGTLVYIPSNHVVDFGPSMWPCAHKKNQVCPRVLLVSTWTDARLGFVGGGRDRKTDESPVDTINREFHEEVGTQILFNDNDFLFAHKDKSLTFFYAKTTSDEDFFNHILSQFYITPRDAYVNEVISVTGYPLWIEGPLSPNDVNWNNNVWGLPRHLTSNRGMLTPTLCNTNIPREHFFLMLSKLDIISTTLMKRVFELANCDAVALHESNKMDTFADFVTKTNQQEENLQEKKRPLENSSSSDV